jgi:hypothetical protein
MVIESASGSVTFIPSSFTLGKGGRVGYVWIGIDAPRSWRIERHDTKPMATDAPTAI